MHTQQEIMNALVQNERKVLKKLYVNNYKKTERYVLQNSGTVAEAKDIYQEAFLSVWHNVKNGKFEPENETALQGYLFQIAKYKWLDVLRSAKKRKELEIEENAEVADEVQTGISSKEKEYQKRVSLAMDAFSNLGEECKKVLKQFYYQKASMREIAAMFDIAEHSARNKKYRCIEQLRTMVNKKQ